MGQRVKRDLASHMKNRGSRAGEHEQPNAGRKRKRHFFFFTFCWSSAVARAKARRNAECQDVRKSNAKGVPGDHADLPKRAKIEAQALQNAFGRPVGQAKAVASRPGLGPPSWSQIGHLGLPEPFPKPPKSSLLVACVQDGAQGAPK